MSTLAVTYTFTAGTLAQSAQVNTNFANIVAWANGGIDNSNISASGLYASQIIPTTGPQATFGGAIGYTFASGATGQVQLAVSAPSGQSVDILDVNLNAVKQMWVDSAGGTHATTLATSGLLTASAGLTVSAGNFAVTSGTFAVGNTGTFYANTVSGTLALGANGNNTLDYGVTTAGRFTFTNGDVVAPNFRGALIGNADTATKLATARAINGVNFDGSAAITIKATATNALTFGTHLTSGGASFDGSSAVTITSDATNANTASTIVARDGAGAFSMGALTATAVTSSGGLAFGASANARFVDTAGATYLVPASSSRTWQFTDAALANVNMTIADGGGVTVNRGNFAVTSGSGTFVGLTAGTGTVQGSSDGSHTAYVPPVYDKTGAALASTTHTDLILITGDGATTAFNITLSGAAAFVSAATYGTFCENTGLVGVVSLKTATSFTVTYPSAPANNSKFYVLACGT